jgi:hypothetical protein
MGRACGHLAVHCQRGTLGPDALLAMPEGNRWRNGWRWADAAIERHKGKTVKLRWVAIAVALFASGSAVFVAWAVLMCIDGVWVAQDKRAEERCDAALKAADEPRRTYATLTRYCSTAETLGNYRVMRNECFDWFVREGSYCHDEFLREASMLPPGGSISTFDVPCGQTARKFCAAAFPVTLWR